jgi:hypothetical protein
MIQRAELRRDLAEAFGVGGSSARRHDRSPFHKKNAKFAKKTAREILPFFAAFAFFLFENRP